MLRAEVCGFRGARPGGGAVGRQGEAGDSERAGAEPGRAARRTRRSRGGTEQETQPDFRRRERSSHGCWGHQPVTPSQSSPRLRVGPGAGSNPSQSSPRLRARAARDSEPEQPATPSRSSPRLRARTDHDSEPKQPATLSWTRSSPRLRTGAARRPRSAGRALARWQGRWCCGRPREACPRLPPTEVPRHRLPRRAGGPSPRQGQPSRRARRPTEAAPRAGKAPRRRMPSAERCARRRWASLARGHGWRPAWDHGPWCRGASPRGARRIGQVAFGGFIGRARFPRPGSPAIGGGLARRSTTPASPALGGAGSASASPRWRGWRAPVRTALSGESGVATSGDERARRTAARRGFLGGFFRDECRFFRQAGRRVGSGLQKPQEL